MIDVGVRQKHEIDAPDVEAEVQGMQVLLACFRPALEHPAVDQEPDVTRLDQRT